jgi:pimeloyl-ACP methyl ester carboxylesterase
MFRQSIRSFTDVERGGSVFMISIEGSTRTVRRGDETSIHYTVSGPEDGPTWVYVPGWGCRRTDFAPVTAFLPADHRVITVDLAEHGDSRSARTAWTVRRCTVVGHSLGGAVGVELARLRPDVVTQVIGIDSFHFLGLYPAIEDEVARRMVRSFEDDFPAAVRSLVVMGSVPGTDPEFGEAIFQKMSSIPPAVGAAALDGLLRWDMDEALRSVPQPVTTLAVRGLLDPAAVDRYADRIDFVVHELGSHHFLVEAPEETAGLLMTARID